MLIGGAGADTITGGDGPDVFRYISFSDSTIIAPDIIMDFTHGQDKIDLSGLGVDSVITGLEGGNTIITVANIGFKITLQGNIALTQDDFIFAH